MRFAIIVLWLLLGAAALAAAQVSLSFGMPGLSIGINAVSYTHLRAHETVLDIVCRLLLEKKKNNSR